MPFLKLTTAEFQIFEDLIHFGMEVKGEQRLLRHDFTNKEQYYNRISQFLNAVMTGGGYRNNFYDKKGQRILKDEYYAAFKSAFNERDPVTNKNFWETTWTEPDEKRKARYAAKFETFCQSIDKSIAELKKPSDEKTVYVQPRFKDLKGRYTGTQRQGHCIDECYLQLDIEEPNKVTGTLEVIYQPDDKYTSPETTLLEVSGDFNHDIAVRLFYQNMDKSVMQKGVIYLEFGSKYELEGHFVGLYNPVPNKRAEVKGDMILKKNREENV